MRISDWSSDVCSSDLFRGRAAICGKPPPSPTPFSGVHPMSRFDSRSTTDEVLAGVDLRGKRILVTGVSAGLGVETARALAARGADVVGAARDLAKAEGATAAVRADRKSTRLNSSH